MGGIQSNSFASFERLREDLLIKLALLLKDPPPTGNKIPLQTKLLELFQLYDESKIGVIPIGFLSLVVQEICLVTKKEKEIEWIGKKFLQVNEENQEEMFDYFLFLEFLFFPMTNCPRQFELKKTLGALDLYTETFEGQLVYNNNKKQRHVLVKQLTFSDRTNIHLIRHQINILQLVQHPNLLKYVTTLEPSENNHLYLIQEYQEHCTLKTTLKAFGPMKETTIRRYLLQILDALEFLHTQGLYHGNLHTESIYIDSYGQVKLGEFYVGHLLRQMSLTTNHHQEVTEYQAPPENTGKTISFTKRTTKTDVWQIGLLALQMYTGQILISINTTNSIPSSVSKSLRVFIRTCLQVDPLKRPEISFLRLMDFFQVDPTKETNDMLKNVCEELDVSMRRLEREIKSPSLRSTSTNNKPTTSRPSYYIYHHHHSSSNSSSNSKKKNTHVTGYY